MSQQATRARNLVDALGALLPGAQILDEKNIAWHSATFSGIRCEIKLVLSGAEARPMAENFSTLLPEHDFHLNRYMVADILVTDISGPDHADRIIVCVEALLLEN